MSTAALPSPVSVEEFLERPERRDGNDEELIEGEVYVSPNAKPQHAEVVRRIERALFPLEKLGFVVLGEVACRVTDFSLPNTDVAAVDREKWEAVLALNEFPRESPALVVEVASPNQSRKLLRKAALYLEHGAEQVWIAHPEKRVIRVITQTHDCEAREGESVEFYGVVILVRDIFPV